MLHFWRVWQCQQKSEGNQAGRRIGKRREKVCKRAYQLQLQQLGPRQSSSGKLMGAVLARTEHELGVLELI